MKARSWLWQLVWWLSVKAACVSAKSLMACPTGSENISAEAYFLASQHRISHGSMAESGESVMA